MTVLYFFADFVVKTSFGVVPICNTLAGYDSKLGFWFDLIVGLLLSTANTEFIGATSKHTSSQLIVKWLFLIFVHFLSPVRQEEPR